MELTKYQKEHMYNVLKIVLPNIDLGIFNGWEKPIELYFRECYICSGKRFLKYHKAPRQIFKLYGCKSAETDTLMRSILLGIATGFAQIRKSLYSDNSYKESIRKLIFWKVSIDEMLNTYPYLLSIYSQYATLYYNTYGCYLAEVKKDIKQAQSNFLIGALYELIELSALIYLDNASLITPWIDKCLGTIYNYNLISSKDNKIKKFSSKIKLSFILSYICRYFLAFYDNNVFSNRIYVGWLQHIHDFLSYIIYENKEQDIIPFLISWRSKFESYFCEEMLKGKKPDDLKLVLEELIVNIGDFESIDDLAKAIYADL